MVLDTRYIKNYWFF